jgi:type IV pilus assembly protein PilP
MKTYPILALALLLSACMAEPQGELKQWMKESAHALRISVAALPSVTIYSPFNYAADAVPDPFKPSKIAPETDPNHVEVQLIPAGVQEILRHRKQPLEGYSLETIKMVGTLKQDSTAYALVVVDRNLYRVKRDDYLGTNFGRVSDVSEGELTIKELVQNGTGDWVERISALQLSESGTARQ